MTYARERQTQHKSDSHSRKFNPKLLKMTRAGLSAQAEHDLGLFKALLSHVEPYLGDIAGKRVLDIGCGQRLPFVRLLKSSGANVTGIDLLEIHLGRRIKKLLSRWRQIGLMKTPLKILNDIWESNYYYYALRSKSGRSLPYGHLDVRNMDATAMIFEDSSFDLIFSNAAFEHFRDLPDAVREMGRVLKPGGIAHISIHLFPSLSGGHRIFYALTEPDTYEMGDIPPWDHLRRKIYPPAVYLNELRERDYREIFSREFVILESRTEFEEPAWSRDLLTPALRQELADYSEEELLKRSVLFILSKKPS